MSKSRKKRNRPKRVLALPDLEMAKSAVLNGLTSKSGQHTYDDRYLDKKPGRWQWEELTKSVPMGQLRLIDKNQLDNYVALLNGIAGGKANSD